jgi:hypothetical protein
MCMDEKVTKTIVSTIVVRTVTLTVSNYGLTRRVQTTLQYTAVVLDPNGHANQFFLLLQVL